MSWYTRARRTCQRSAISAGVRRASTTPAVEQRHGTAQERRTRPRRDAAFILSPPIGIARRENQFSGEEERRVCYGRRSPARDVRSGGPSKQELPPQEPRPPAGD